MINELLTHQAYVRECPEDEDCNLYTTHYSITIIDTSYEESLTDKCIDIQSYRIIDNKRYILSTKISNSIPLMLSRIQKISNFTNTNYIAFSDAPVPIVPNTNLTLSNTEDTEEEDGPRDYLKLLRDN